MAETGPRMCICHRQVVLGRSTGPTNKRPGGLTSYYPNQSVTVLLLADLTGTRMEPLTLFSFLFLWTSNLYDLILFLFMPLGPKSNNFYDEFLERCCFF